MTSATIRADIQQGLADAIAEVGSSGVDKVYRVRSTTTSTSPLDIGTTTETVTELVNAIFVNYSINLVGGNIRAGDRELISDHTVEILPGDIIRQGTTNYIVIPTNPVAPTSDVLLYKSQCRVQ